MQLGWYLCYLYTAHAYMTINLCTRTVLIHPHSKPLKHLHSISKHDFTLPGAPSIFPQNPHSSHSKALLPLAAPSAHPHHSPGLLLRPCTYVPLWPPCPAELQLIRVRDRERVSQQLHTLFAGQSLQRKPVTTSVSATTCASKPLLRTPRAYFNRTQVQISSRHL